MGDLRQAVTGLYGKVPCCADFVSVNLPHSFIEPWDFWLQAALTASRDQLDTEWLNCYLAAPVWRFSLAPEVSGPAAVAGVLIPSVDAVNRHFPLVVVALVPVQSPLQISRGVGTWFGKGEALALACLDPVLNLETLEHRLAALIWTAAVPPLVTDAIVCSVQEDDLSTRFSLGCGDANSAVTDMNCVALLDALLSRRYGRYGVWWTRGSDRVAPCVVVTRGLPSPEMFSTFLRDGSNDRYT